MAPDPRTAPITWTRRDDARVDALAAAFWDDPDAFLRAHGTLVKESGYHRRVLRVATADGDVLVKCFAFSTLGERLQWRMRSSAPHKEWRFLTMLAGDDVPVPAPLALGWSTANGVKAWLLIACAAHAVTYDRVAPPPDGPAARAAARALAGTIAAMHFTGVTHGDTHAGNLLHLRAENRWLITDFQHARHGRLSRAACVSDLVQLQHCLGKKVRLRVRLAFLLAYLRAFARLAGGGADVENFEWRSLFFEIRAKSGRYSIAQAAARSRRTVRRTKDTVPLACWTPATDVPAWFTHGWAARGCSRQLLCDLLHLLDDPNWHLRADVSLIKNTRRAVSAVYAHPHGSVFVHHERPLSGLRGFLFNLTRVPVVERLWRSAWRLRYLHINTPHPVLAAAGTRGRVTVHAYRGDTVSLEAVARHGMAALPRHNAHDIVRAVAAAVAFMHTRGVAHRRLRPSNVLLSANGSGPVTVTFSEIDTLRFYTVLPFTRRARDLAALYADMRDIVGESTARLFLRAYLRFAQEPLDVRALLVAVRDIAVPYA